MNLESTAEQTFDTALDTESENKSVNDVNENMQTSNNATENNSDNPALWKNIDDGFRLYILVKIRITSGKPYSRKVRAYYVFYH